MFICTVLILLLLVDSNQTLSKILKMLFITINYCIRKFCFEFLIHVALFSNSACFPLWFFQMSYSRRSRYSPSPSPPHKRYSRSVSKSRSRSRSRSYDASDIENPGNSLYVTGLSRRVTKKDLEKHFSEEGKVEDVRLVIDPWTRESRGFGFVSMSSIKDADRCVKYLDGSVLEGRVITVEKARRRRGRTPTPGRYLGLRTVYGRRRSPTYSPYSRSCSPRHSPERDSSRSRSSSYSPYDRRRSYSRSTSPYSRRRAYSPSTYDYRRRRHHSRSYSPEDCYYRRRGRYHSRDYSPDYRRSSRGYSPSDYRRDYSPEYRRRSRRYRSGSPRERYNYRSNSRRYCSVSRSVSSSPRRHYMSCTSSRSLIRSRRRFSPNRSASWSCSSDSVSSSRSASPTNS
ncbi:hypothetical protein R6Q59_025778 [Mikania micrantha]